MKQLHAGNFLLLSIYMPYHGIGLTCIVGLCLLSDSQRFSSVPAQVYNYQADYRLHSMALHEEGSNSIATLFLSQSWHIRKKAVSDRIWNGPAGFFFSGSSR
jgi:hypothetical protein